MTERHVNITRVDGEVTEVDLVEKSAPGEKTAVVINGVRLEAKSVKFSVPVYRKTKK